MNNLLDDPSQDNLKWVRAYSELNEEVCQILGKALGYPWYKDDQKNFPDATEEHGVCVGEHVAASIAEEAANKLKMLEALVGHYKAGSARQKRMIEAIKEARDRWQARAELLEQKLAIANAEK